MNSQYEEKELGEERELQCITDESILRTETLTQIFDSTYIQPPPIIESFLYPGTYLFCGAPKVGKSFQI